MNVQFDHNQYKELGVGDRVGAHHYKVVQRGDEETQHTYVVPIAHHEIGHIVHEADEVTYLESVYPAAVTMAPVEIAKTHFVTGASRSDATGRGRFDLIPYEAMLSLARRYEMGAAHFGERNWERGQPLSRLLSSMRRHAHQIGYCYKEDHVGAVLWNAAAFVTMVARMEAGILPKEIDDIGYFTNREAQK